MKRLLVIAPLGGRGDAPDRAQIALVPGGLVHPDGRLSAMLEDRVAAAARLYHDGRVDAVLVSGDHGQTTYDEVTPMRKRLIALGVSAPDVFEDHAGFDTWASAVRAREVFGAESAIVVTQEFHLSRAVWLARRAGLVGPRDPRAGEGARDGRAASRPTLPRAADLTRRRRPRLVGPGRGRGAELASRFRSSGPVIGPDGRSWWSAMNGGIPGVRGRSSPAFRGEQTALELPANF